jgi:hypothetical protein
MGNKQQAKQIEITEPVLNQHILNARWEGLTGR